MNKKEHLLVCVNEECSEVAKAITKILRFGVDDRYPPISGTTNLEKLSEECTDVLAVLEMLEDAKIVQINRSRAAIELKKAKVFRYMDYARERKTLR